MYIHSVKLVNFKSIGEYPESEIILEPRVTAIIGRNECGKSNVLEGIANINFLKENKNAFLSENINRNIQYGSENKYIIVLKSNSQEFTLGIDEDTIVEITKTNYCVKGGFLSYYIAYIYGDIEELLYELNTIGTNPFRVRDQELTNYRNAIKALADLDNLNIYSINKAFLFMLNKINSLPEDKKSNMAKLLKKGMEKLEHAMNMFPPIFYRKADKHLRTAYKLEEIEKELKNNSESANSLLPDFIKLIDVSADEFIFAAKTGSLPQQGTIRRKINRIIERKINQEFQEFYKTEEIALELEFNAGIVSFLVRSGDGEALALSERSSGLRWYLELFIDAQVNNSISQNTVYLLDEPGTSLHVNAQKELLRLFTHLSKQGNQIVYTTHSPYMLNLEEEGIHRIRAVVKSSDGNTKVYKTAYDSRIAPETQEDTLAPIISALGMNLQNTVGPALGKMNIVTEGMSDYIYICMMAKLLGVDTNKYAIIPSVGVTNSINVCNILQGWKCDFLALFDYDNEGVEKGGEYMRRELFYELGKHFHYLKDVQQEEIKMQTYKRSSYRIEELVTCEEIDRFCATTNTSKAIGKVLMAKLISNAVEDGTYVLGKKCCDNFNELFKRVGLI